MAILYLVAKLLSLPEKSSRKCFAPIMLSVSVVSNCFGVMGDGKPADNWTVLKVKISCPVKIRKEVLFDVEI